MGMKYDFPKMVDLIPEDEKDGAKITHRVVTQEEINVNRLRYLMSPGPRWLNDGMSPGTYCVLEVDGWLVMSDTWMERFTNQRIIEKATGDVLIAGLGIGLILTLLEEKDGVKSITVVEKSKDVIDLVAPYYNNLTIDIVNADIFEWEPTVKFDTIYFDIWPDISGDHYEETKTLHKKYRRSLNRSNPDHFMQSWMRNEFRKLRRKAIREGWDD